MRYKLNPAADATRLQLSLSYRAINVLYQIIGDVLTEEQSFGDTGHPENVLEALQAIFLPYVEQVHQNPKLNGQKATIETDLGAVKLMNQFNEIEISQVEAFGESGYRIKDLHGIADALFPLVMVEKSEAEQAADFEAYRSKYTEAEYRAVHGAQS